MKTRRLPSSLRVVLGLGGVLLVASCSKPQTVARPAEAVPTHAHTAQQGGVLAELGAEEFHLEFTRGESPGVLRVFVMDGEVEKFIRIDAPSFPATVRAGDLELPVVFQAVANSATGEKVGDTALFETTASLPAHAGVSVTISALTVKGRLYRDIKATLPAN